MAVTVAFSGTVVDVANATLLQYAGGSAIAASGHVIVNAAIKEKQVNLIANVKSLASGASIQFSIQEIDPVDAANSVISPIASQPAVSTGTFTGPISSAVLDSAQLPVTLGSAFLVSWTVTGSPACACNLTVVGKV